MRPTLVSERPVAANVSVHCTFLLPVFHIDTCIYIREILRQSSGSVTRVLVNQCVPIDGMTLGVGAADYMIHTSSLYKDCTHRTRLGFFCFHFQSVENQQKTEMAFAHLLRKYNQKVNMLVSLVCLLAETVS